MKLSMFTYLLITLKICLESQLVYILIEHDEQFLNSNINQT